MGIINTKIKVTARDAVRSHSLSTKVDETSHLWVEPSAAGCALEEKDPMVEPAVDQPQAGRTVAGSAGEA